MESPLPVSSSLQSEERVAWSVMELTQRIRGVLEPAFFQVWVKGEISNYKPASSGHVYFSLKDASACISAACFGWGARKSRSFDLKEGLEVLCRGKVAVYPPRGNYQLVVDSIEPLGLGGLQLAFEELKQKLAAEGLFRPEFKRPLPRFPEKIVVVTSPTGAVIQDMLKILRRRAPQIQVRIIPSLVQGKEAPLQLIQGIQLANQQKAGDLIVVARGGGSAEDLWAFNDEALARAIRGSTIPIISAVGHEVDFTIADFVSDLRAPTPSAAAEILSERWVEAAYGLEDLFRRMQQVVVRDLAHKKQIFEHLSARLMSPQDRLREQMQRMDEWSLRFQRAMKAHWERKQGSFLRGVAQMDALSPLKVLERGYVIVQEKETRSIIRSSKGLQLGQEWVVKFYDGEVSVQVL